jgi:nuclear transport factor 2 (NTF2) superfamily protein
MSAIIVENAWNTRTLGRMAAIYADDSVCRNPADHRYRSYGHEQWEFADNGLMRRREASPDFSPEAGASGL